MDTSIASGLVDTIGTITTGKSSNKLTDVVDKVSSFFSNNPLASASKKLNNKPEMIEYDRILTDMNSIFLSDDPDEYVGAMCGMAQEYILNKIDTIEYEIADITNLMDCFIDNMIREAEWLLEVKTFPNLISTCLDMEEQIMTLLTNVAALQGRIFTHGNYSRSRLEQIDKQIYDILANNAEIRRALGLYDPDAHSQTDLKSFVKYIKQRLEDLMQEIKNLGDFPDQFSAQINPVDIMYKNFSRLYEYVCKASKLIANNTMIWHKSKLQELKSNTFGIGQNLYKALVILDRYKYSNMLKDEYKGEKEEDKNGTVIGRMLKNLTTDIKKFDMSPFEKLIKELVYLVNVILAQASRLASTPFQALAAALQERKIPSNLHNFFTKEGWEKISTGEWAKKYGFDKYLKLDIKAISLDLLHRKGDKIGIPVDKIPKIGTLIALGSRAKDLKKKIGNELSGFKDLLKANGNLKDVLPVEVKQKVEDMAKSSSQMQEAIETADPAKMADVLTSPNNLTQSGAMADTIAKVAAEAESDPNTSMTVLEKNSLLQAKELLAGDHHQECKQRLIGMLGTGLGISKETVDSFVTPVYDDVLASLESLVKMYDANIGNSDNAEEAVTDPDAVIPESAVSTPQITEATKKVKDIQGLDNLGELFNSRTGSSTVTFIWEDGTKTKVEFEKIELEPPVNSVTVTFSEGVKYTRIVRSEGKHKTVIKTKLTPQEAYNMREGAFRGTIRGMDGVTGQSTMVSCLDDYIHQISSTGSSVLTSK